MSKPTPGPWKLAALNTNYAIRAKSDDVLICQMSWHSSHRMHYTLKEESFANARLIAAAPDMYDVLTSIEAVIFGGNQDHFDLMFCVGSPIRNALCDAITKAEQA